MSGPDEFEEEVVPRPSSLIESLRSIGYSPETSIADLIDNSLAAGARTISVQFNWEGPASSMVMIDDGAGMDEDTLRDAMRPGSTNPLEDRSGEDLGRFGLGLKTASFAQARSLTVASRSGKKAALRRWDLDHVQSTDRWSLLSTPPPEAPELMDLLEVRTGTLVAWHRMDRLVDERSKSDARAAAQFFALVDRVRVHLEMVFHRFIDEDALVLTVNGYRCEAWDPFLRKHGSTQVLPGESLALTVPGQVRARKVTITPYVLPHRSRLTPEERQRAAGPRGWNLQQGFYLYRARRLIVAGDWFDPGIKPEEHHKLARIAVEVDQSVDSLWALDVRKSRARPPLALRGDFMRVASATRGRAEAVYRERGRAQVGQNRRQKAAPVWIVDVAGKLVTYRINRDHLMIKRALDGLSPADRRTTESILKLAEGNVPTAHILSIGFGSEERLDREVDEAALASTARELFDALIASGATEAQARAALLAAEPFDRVPQIVESLERTT